MKKKPDLLLPPTPPVLPPKIMRHHGIVRRDEFFHMRSPRYRSAVLRYLRAENGYAAAALAPYAALTRTLEKEIALHIPARSQSVPVVLGPYVYYSRTVKGKNYPLYCRRKGTMTAPEEIILDVNVCAKGHDACVIGGMEISPDHTQLLYGINFDGSSTFTLRVRHLQTLRDQPHALRKTDGEGVWSQDGQYLFYVALERATHRAYRVMRHKLGTLQRDDVCIFEEKDETFCVGVWKCKSDRYILISSDSPDSTESYYFEAAQPCAEPILIAPRRPNREYYPEMIGDDLYILHNGNGAYDFEMAHCLLSEAQNEAAWQCIVPHEPGRFIEEFELFDAEVVLLCRKKALPMVAFYNRKPFALREEKVFSERPHTLSFGDNPNENATVLRVVLSVLNKPEETLEYNPLTNTCQLLKQQHIPGYDPDLYEAELRFVTARDGTQIPLSLCYKRDCFTPGKPMPVLLYGYGAYGLSCEMALRPSRISLMERGFCCATAHVRGGSECGYRWYEDGKLMQKKNSFTDFCDCARYLIAQKITQPAQLMIAGGSAGGLLVGAALNAEPELFGGAHLCVPFVDVLNTMLDKDLPLTTGEYGEWGNPNEKEAFEAIYDYAPYEQLAARPYPPLYVTGGLNDDLVSFHEPAKYVAKLRKNHFSANPILFFTDLSSGHSGPTGRRAEIRELARDLTFYLTGTLLAQKERPSC